MDSFRLKIFAHSFEDARGSGGKKGELINTTLNLFQSGCVEVCHFFDLFFYKPDPYEPWTLKISSVVSRNGDLTSFSLTH